MTSNSFDKIDNLIAVPESSRKDKKIVLDAKVLETEKECRKVLPEDRYIRNLETLIVRDYFPELPKLKAQAEYMEALSKNDLVKIRELQVRYSTRRTDRRTSPSQRPSSVFDPDTPAASVDREIPYSNTEGDNEILAKKPKKEAPLDKFTVQTYLDKYTSEDNASFEELAALHNRRERVKNSWMYEAEKRHNESLVYREPEMITDADHQLVSRKNEHVEKPLDVDNWTYKARNAVLFNNIDEAPLTLEEYIERSKQGERIINKEATRYKNELLKQTEQKTLARAALKYQPGSSAGHIDITGEEKKISAKNLGIVATPTPMPDDSPFMTWGEIDGTPFRLDAPDIPESAEDAPQFKIPDVPIREKIAQEIAEKIASHYHNKRKHAMDQIKEMAPKTPKFNHSVRSSCKPTMSPAASMFAQKLGIRVSTDKLMKISSSPKRTPSTSFSPAIFRMVRVKNEPKSRSSTPQLSTHQLSVTDNLLQIPTSPQHLESPAEKRNLSRPRAADYF